MANRRTATRRSNQKNLSEQDVQEIFQDTLTIVLAIAVIVFLVAVAGQL